MVVVQALAVQRAHEQFSWLRLAYPEEAGYDVMVVEEAERRSEAHLWRRQGLFWFTACGSKKVGDERQ